MSAAPHSTYDLTTFCRKTTGDIPPKLVGAATTVVGSEMYLFGGRLFTERRMVADLHVFDLETYIWQVIPPSLDDDVPCPRYFHSLESWNNQLILFGGMTDEPDSPDEYRVLNDVRFFDLETLHWIKPSRSPTPESLLPQARYAHLTSVAADRLFIIGGQDYYNIWLSDICVYDLITQTWSEERDHPVHWGTYRSIAVSSSQVVRFPEVKLPHGRDSPVLSPEDLPSSSLIHLPYSAAPDDENPSNIYVYSNRNFAHVKRELEVLSPSENTGFTVQDLSSSFSGTELPPGLRFPSGAIQGSHLIVSGTHIATSAHEYSIWALDLKTMHWSQIKTGKALEMGSWVRGCLWADDNKFIIFGNRARNLADDYTCRILSWDHVAVVDLEAFGIYQPPALKLDILMQELGLEAFKKRTLADFDIVCDDGRRLICSRRLLEERWPWFRERRLKMLQDAMSALEVDSSTSTVTTRGIDSRLTPRALHLPEPYPIATALIQYFYTLALVTPLQTTPAVLSQLLILSANYELPHLHSLVRHAMHRTLSYRTSRGVYEVATLCSCRSLQVRAMRILMASGREEAAPHSEAGRMTPVANSEAGPSTLPLLRTRERRERDIVDLRQTYTEELPPIPFVEHQPSLREKPSGNFDQRNARRDRNRVEEYRPTTYDKEEPFRMAVERNRPQPRIQTRDETFRSPGPSEPTSSEGDGFYPGFTNPSSMPNSASTPESSYFSSRRQLIGSMTPSLIFSSTGSSQTESLGPRTPSQDQCWLPGIAETYTDAEGTNGVAEVQWPQGKSHGEPFVPGVGITEEARQVDSREMSVPNHLERASSPVLSNSKVGRLWRRKNSSTDQVSSPVENSKQQKAEKRLKKEAAKARTEELARALRQRARTRAEESVVGSSSQNERVSNLREPASLYGGLARGGLTL